MHRCALRALCAVLASVLSGASIAQDQAETDAELRRLLEPTPNGKPPAASLERIAAAALQTREIALLRDACRALAAAPRDSLAAETVAAFFGRLDSSDLREVGAVLWVLSHNLGRLGERKARHLEMLRTGETRPELAWGMFAITLADSGDPAIVAEVLEAWSRAEVRDDRRFAWQAALALAALRIDDEATRARIRSLVAGTPDPTWYELLLIAQHGTRDEVAAALAKPPDSWLGEPFARLALIARLEPLEGASSFEDETRRLLDHSPVAELLGMDAACLAVALELHWPRAARTRGGVEHCEDLLPRIRRALAPWTSDARRLDRILNLARARGRAWRELEIQAAASGTDPWGHAYVIELRAAGDAIGSAGEDGVLHSADDLWVPIAKR